MDFSAIPLELRSLRQWTVWKSVLKGGKVTKPPYRADNTDRLASSTDPTTWCSFEEAAACYAANSSVYGGVGFMLTTADPYVVWDVDDGARVVDPHYVATRASMVQAMLSLGSYAETSPSGKGLHVWVRGSMPVAGRKLNVLAIEAYASVRFMTCTGLQVRGSGDSVLDGQALLDEMGLTRPVVEATTDNDPRRPLDLTDDQVMYQCWTAASFQERWSRTVWGEAPDDWSRGFVELLRVLDRYTGNTEQVRRLVCSSPMVKATPPSKNGEHRWSKADRIFASELLRVRGYAAGDEQAVAHGRMVWACIEENKARLAAAELAVQRDEMRRQEEMLLAQERALQQRRCDGQNVDGLSPVALDVLQRFNALLNGEHLRLTPPPGVAGQLVLAAEKASRIPFLLYAIPATLSVLGGIVSRAYAPQGGSPLNMNYVVLGTTGTGKSQAIKAWKGFVQQALDSVHHSIRPANRILAEEAMSVQGIWSDLEQVPGCVWVVDEAANQLRVLADPKTGTETGLLGFFNKCYDSAHHGEEMQLPRSVASKNAGYKPIQKLSLNTFMTTTPDSLDLTDKNITNGFVSRVVFVRYDGSGVAEQRYPETACPPNLLPRIADLLCAAQAVDQAYHMNQAQGVAATRVVGTADVEDLAWELSQVCSGVTRAANEKMIPRGYVAFNRVSQSAMRLACVLAIAENPWAPAVTAEQYRWAMGYLVQNMAQLMSSMDTGVIGDKVNDDFAAMERVYKSLVKRGAAKGLPGVPRSVLHREMKTHAPCRSSKEGPSQAATRSIKLAVEENFAEEIPGESKGRGRPPTYIRLVG